VQCHNPHASANKHGLVRTGEDLCFGCHEPLKKLKSAKSVHAPFDGGDCATCHKSHSSGQPGLLTDNAQKLCLQCHDPSESRLVTAHRGFPVSELQCANCHNPHGSEQAHLIRSKPHKVFLACDRCHDAKGPKKTALQAGVNELCYRCHSAVKVASQKHGAHKALATSNCVTCHNPHTADEKGLIKGNNERRLCLSCHKETQAHLAASASIHPVRANGGRCTTCHASHQSEFPGLTKRAGDKLCNDCHAGHAQFGHPMGVDPRTNKTMTCMSCHVAHGSQFASILTANPKRELCVQCHASDGAIGH
jgi:predicted CXXCH cytochrome family protein